MTRQPGGGRDAAVLIPVDSVCFGDSPRVSGEDLNHVRALADSPTDLPPIIVHRGTMRVIDGAHRLLAARLRGEHHIRIHYFDGTGEDAFVLAVQANLRHGLPLTAADRQAAARRIIAARPEWSDRRVGAVAGLAGTTVAALRKHVLPSAAATARVGADGRVRPLDSGERRLLASRLIKEQPGAPVREIARKAGIAPSTALDVRDRLRRGVDPVPQQKRKKTAQQPDIPAPEKTRDSIMDVLRRDPSLRFTEGGRTLLRWLEVNTAAAQELPGYAGSVPEHCTKLVADIARHAARRWLDFADQVEAGHWIAE